MTCPRSVAENTREEAKQLINSSMHKTNSTQSEVTERLGERLQNINLWKFELEKTIRDIVSAFCYESDLFLEILKFSHNLDCRNRASYG